MNFENLKMTDLFSCPPLILQNLKTLLKLHIREPKESRWPNMKFFNVPLNNTSFLMLLSEQNFIP